MQRIMLKSKIHRASITRCDLNYEGSITIDLALAEKANLKEFERVDVYNVTNGKRLSTYVLYGERNSGVIGLNGAAARLGEVGDLVIIASYTVYDEEELKNFKPVILLVDENNKIKEIR